MQTINVNDMRVTDQYAMYNGDCVEVLSSIPDNSIHFSMYSPPFIGLYVYSNSDRDMGNCKSDEEFFNHYEFFAKEMYRVMMPGRIMAVHCMDIPAMKERDGYIGLKDFPGQLCKIYQDAGFILHSRITIWKNPVAEMTRTKALGLLHKQIRKDSTMCRQGCADYILAFRKPGENPERVEHTMENFPVAVWQRYASPVWMDIKQKDTLNYRIARVDEDEKHICALNTQVVKRCIELWSNRGDVVLDPFGGIGTVPYMAVKLGRKGVGIELKDSYYQQAIRNLNEAVNEPIQLDLEDEIDRVIGEDEYNI